MMRLLSHCHGEKTKDEIQRFQRTIILWRLGRCVIIQIFNELLIDDFCLS